MTTFLSVFGLLAVISTVNCQFRFDYTFDAKVGGWLKLHRIPASFLDAFRQCDAEGAVLASPVNIYLKNAMIRLHKQQINQNCGLYTGIHSTFTKGAYASVEGIPLAKMSIDWSPNEPDNFEDSEECIVMLQNGTMADVRCTETFPYVCYKKKTLNMAINECGTIDNGYQLDTRTGSCYKFHNIGRTWQQAYKVCMAEGGYLAIVNSETEVQVIKDLFAKYPADKIFSRWKNGASIGFHDWGDTGVWWTIHGQRLHDTGYSTFAKGQPDNNDNFGAGGSSCGGIFRDGLLDDFWCTGTNIVFFCEKNPDSLLGQDDEI